jgi:hypothetical protein
LTPRESAGALLALGLAACGVLLPVLLLAVGADYLAPRNLVAAMIPVTMVIAVIVAARATGRAGLALAALLAIAFLAIDIDVELSRRLQRGDWSGVARVLGEPIPAAAFGGGAQGRVDGARDRVITTVELGAAPLEYYLPPLHNLARGSTVTVSEIDEIGYAPLRKGSQQPPVPGFRLLARRDSNGLILYRFLAPTPRVVSEATLRRHVITLAHPEVLVR